eukprot:4702491-Amphidinium_carterae.2
MLPEPLRSSSQEPSATQAVRSNGACRKKQVTATLPTTMNCATNSQVNERIPSAAGTCMPDSIALSTLPYSRIVPPPKQEETTNKSETQADHEPSPRTINREGKIYDPCYASGV